MKRKNLIISLLTAILITSSMVLFACGDIGTAKDTFQAFQSTMQTYKENTNLFSHSTISEINMETDFYLNNFFVKNNDGLNSEDFYQYYILTATGLNFIDKYYVLIENLKGSYNYTTLMNDIDEMNVSYEELKIENLNVANIEDTAENEIYNGYFARYKLYTKEFINKVYQTAIDLGEFLINNVKYTENLATDLQTDEEVKFYIDHQFLLIYNDFRLTLLQSCKGQDLSGNSIYNTSYSYLKFIATEQVKQLKTFTPENMKDVVYVFSAINNQRDIFYKAIDNFSIYDYLNTYEGSIDAYVNVNSNADVYYNQIYNYYCNTNSIILLTHHYIRENIVVSE